MNAQQAPPRPYFRIDRPHDSDAHLGRSLRESEHALYSRFSDDGVGIEDFDVVVDKLAQATGYSRTVIRSAVLSYHRLTDLPRLRALHNEQKLLTLGHLTAIRRKLEELGPDADAEILAGIDDFLVEQFTPTRQSQPFPDPAAVTRKLRAHIRRIDPALGYNPKKRKEREARRDHGAEFFLEDFGGITKGMMNLTTDTATLAAVRAFVQQCGLEHKLSSHDTVVKLLTGEITPAAKARIQVYAPKGREAGQPVFIPGFGWTEPDATVAFDEMCAQTPPSVADMDGVRENTTPSYVPTADMRALVEARDGTCIYPGCNHPAEQCQLDHRIPFAEGGETRVDNLHCLCQRHHNLKTDRRAFYVVDPATGDAIWLYEDGTFEVSEPSGLLTAQLGAEDPRWRASISEVKRRRERAAEFHARGHAIMDQYEKDQDIIECEFALDQLEEQFDMRFPFHPEPEWWMGLTPPVDAPFPDYEWEDNPDDLRFDDANIPLPEAG